MTATFYVNLYAQVEAEVKIPKENYSNKLSCNKWLQQQFTQKRKNFSYNLFHIFLEWYVTKSSSPWHTFDLAFFKKATTYKNFFTL